MYPFCIMTVNKPGRWMQVAMANPHIHPSNGKLGHEKIMTDKGKKKKKTTKFFFNHHNRT